MWLTERLTPDHKTIADFRKDNGKAIRKVCREFMFLFRRLQLFPEAVAVIDGSKFKAAKNRDRNYTQAKLRRRLEQIDESIARYLSQFDSADREESAIGQTKRGRLQEKIKKLKEEIKRLKGIERELRETPDQQISEIDPDARSMATSGRGSGLVGYNAQIAVEPKHHHIVADEVTNVGNDRAQLATMAGKAREAMDSDEFTAAADRGYYKGEEILACEDAGVTIVLPKPRTSGNQAKGLFARERFRYDPQANEYRCPAGERLIWRCRNVEAGRTLDTYWSSACPRCPIKGQCTTGKERRIRRWEHEAVLEKVQARLDAQPENMHPRRQTVEHPFGTIKSWMGYTHFLTKTLPRVPTETSHLHVLAYNLKGAGHEHPWDRIAGGGTAGLRGHFSTRTGL
jgi:hypothetical protein